MVVGAEHKVIQQRVEAGVLQDGLRAITSGLTPDSEVVVEGLQNAVPGNEVTPVEKAMAAPAAASSSQGS